MYVHMLFISVIWSYFDISEVCPDNYDYLPGYNCYREITTQYNWADADTNCQNLGASLATIENQQKWALIYPWALATGNIASTSVWN